MLALKPRKATWLSHDTMTSRLYSWVHGEWISYFRRTCQSESMSTEPVVLTEGVCSLITKHGFQISRHQLSTQWHVMLLDIYNLLHFSSAKLLHGNLWNLFAILWLGYKPLWVTQYKMLLFNKEQLLVCHFRVELSPHNTLITHELCKLEPSNLPKLTLKPCLAGRSGSYKSRSNEKIPISLLQNLNHQKWRRNRLNCLPNE